jgi:hypothetical protein
LFANANKSRPDGIVTLVWSKPPLPSVRYNTEVFAGTVRGVGAVCWLASEKTKTRDRERETAARRAGIGTSIVQIS